MTVADFGFNMVLDIFLLKFIVDSHNKIYTFGFVQAIDLLSNPRKLSRINCPFTDFINPPLGEFKLNKLANEAGVFIKAKVNGLNSNMLMDIGATVTLVYTRLFKSMTYYALQR